MSSTSSTECRQALAVEELGEDDIASILAAEVPAEYAYLDAELDR